MCVRGDAPYIDSRTASAYDRPMPRLLQFYGVIGFVVRQTYGRFMTGLP